MSDKATGYKHDSSDKKLDASAGADGEATKASDGSASKGPGHDPEKIARHDDKGKDRLFEHREQHDDAEQKSEKTRLARESADVAKPDA